MKLLSVICEILKIRYNAYNLDYTYFIDQNESYNLFNKLFKLNHVHSYFNQKKLENII